MNTKTITIEWFEEKSWLATRSDFKSVLESFSGIGETPKIALQNLLAEEDQFEQEQLRLPIPLSESQSISSRWMDKYDNY